MFDSKWAWSWVKMPSSAAGDLSLPFGVPDASLPLHFVLEACELWGPPAFLSSLPRQVFEPPPVAWRETQSWDRVGVIANVSPKHSWCQGWKTWFSSLMGPEKQGSKYFGFLIQTSLPPLLEYYREEMKVEGREQTLKYKDTFLFYIYWDVNSANYNY